MKLIKNQKGFSIIESLLAVIAITLIGFVIFYVYNANKKTNASLNGPSSSIEKSKASSLDDSDQTEKTTLKNKDWQIYRDVKYGFSLEYPKDWKFVAAGTKAGGGEFPIAEFIPASEFPGGDNSKAIFINNKERTNLTLKQYVEKYAPKFDGSEGGSKPVSSEYSVINGYDTYTTIGQIYGGYNYFVYVDGNGTVVEFHYLGNTDSLLNTYKKIIDSIQFNN